MWGNASGGYADELRLKSTPPTDGGENGTYINLRAHGGSLDFEHTKVIFRHLHRRAFVSFLRQSP